MKAPFCCRLALFALGVSILGGLAEPAHAVRTPMRISTGEGLYSLIVPELDVMQRLPESQLSLFDIHLAKMFEVTHHMCITDNLSPGTSWTYLAGSGSRVVKADLIITCEQAQGLASVYGLATPELTPITISLEEAGSSSKTLDIPTFDLSDYKEDAWLQFTQTYKPLATTSPPREVSNISCDSNFRVVTTTDGSNLNLREAPEGLIIGALPNGTEVLLRNAVARGEWVEVAVAGDLTGWVAAEFLSSLDNSVFNGSMKVKTLEGGSINLRSRPALDATIIDQLATGTVVTHNGFEGNWSNITTTNGVTGYASSQFLVCD